MGRRDKTDFWNEDKNELVSVVLRIPDSGLVTFKGYFRIEIRIQKDSEKITN